MENNNAVRAEIISPDLERKEHPGLKNLKRGHKRGPTKVTTTIKEAVLLAANNVGDQLYEEGQAGTGMQLQNKGLVGYLEAVARTDMKAFTGLMAKIMPVQIQAEVSINDGLAERLKRARERVIDVTPNRQEQTNGYADSSDGAGGDSDGTGGSGGDLVDQGGEGTVVYRGEDGRDG